MKFSAKSLGAVAMRTIFCAGFVAAPAAAQSDRPPNSMQKRGPNLSAAQVVPLQDATLYSGWRASRVLGSPVASKGGEQVGTVRNILLRHNGQVHALIVVGDSGFRGSPEFVYRIEWSSIEAGRFPHQIVADVFRSSQELNSLFSDRDAGGTFRASEVLGDYARLQTGYGYGYVSDVVFDKSGRLRATLVTRDGPSGGGTYAFGFPGTTGRWDPAASYYGLPYVTAEQATSAGILVDAKRFGDRPDRTVGEGRSQKP